MLEVPVESHAVDFSENTADINEYFTKRLEKMKSSSDDKNKKREFLHI